MESNTNIKKEISLSPLVVSKVYKSDFQKEQTLTAELRQTVSTVSHYPTKTVTNSLQSNMFAIEDFGFEAKTFPNVEERVAFVNVPLGSTVEAVQGKLAEAPGAVLYRILSNRPIVTDTEEHAINNPEFPDMTLDTKANSQAVREPKAEDGSNGKLILMNGKIQYRRIAFSLEAKEDIDLRTTPLNEFYASPELKAEINNVSYVPTGQEI